jgi:hypothetical protein
VAGLTDTITGLTNSQPYWFYVTAENMDGVESENSCIVRCLAGAGNSGDEDSTWGMSEQPTFQYVPEGDLIHAKIGLNWVAPDNTWIENGSQILLTLYGPGLAAGTPENPAEQAFVVPRLCSDSSDYVWYYKEFRKGDLTGGTIYYWWLAFYVVRVNGIDYHFGDPLIHGQAGCLWPS